MFFAKEELLLDVSSSFHLYQLSKMQCISSSGSHLAQYSTLQVIHSPQNPSAFMAFHWLLMVQTKRGQGDYKSLIRQKNYSDLFQKVVDNMCKADKQSAAWCVSKRQQMLKDSYPQHRFDSTVSDSQHLPVNFSSACICAPCVRFSLISAGVMCKEWRQNMVWSGAEILQLWCVTITIL